jgi:hypothetical protein
MVRAATLRLTVVVMISSFFFSSLAFLQVEGTEETIVYPVREESRGHRSIDSPVGGESILLSRNNT